jgi:hypothetical protein
VGGTITKSRVEMTTLEKVRQLEQYIAADAATVNPVVDTTISKLIERERASLLDLHARLIQQCKVFEDTYSLSSSEFSARYVRGELGDDMDFIEWASTIEMLANLEKRLALLSVDSAT